ncbi:MAG: hypothetical protein AB7I27_06260 [Bacteriovoracaceae bacterium]
MSEEFLVTFIKEFEHSVEESGNQRLKISLGSDFEPLKLPRDAWGALKDGIVWGAGGGTYLINKRYLPLVRRDLTAKTNPGKLTIATGLTDKIEELLNPKLLIRELFEEIVIVHKTKGLVLPEVAKMDTQQWIKESVLKARIDFQGEHWVKASFEEDLKDTVLVNYQGELTEVKCVLSFFPPKAINVMFIVKLTLEDLKSYKFLDTEVVISDGEIKPLSREVFLLDLEKDLLLDQNFREHSVQAFEFTSHAQDLINYVRGVLK